MGAALGGTFDALWNVAGLAIQVSVPAFAMVGMGAMVGGGIGAGQFDLPLQATATF